MAAFLRADLESLPTYIPGRSIPAAVKLASNEVSAPPPPNVIAAICAAAETVNRYPDSTASTLVQQLAAGLDVPAAWLAVGCGSVMLCQQLVQATCGPSDEVVFAWRSFEAYPIITRVAHARPRPVPLRADHTLDPQALLDAITPATRLVFVCNPNNPTGTAVRRDELTTFLDAVPSGVLVALDEAYHEFVTDPAVPDGVALSRGRDNLAVLRTFSKAYRLAGLRVGYCVAPPPVITAMHRVYLPFSVNTLAQAAALASLEVAGELLARCRVVAAERERVRAELLAMGYAVPESQANFLWLPLGTRTEAFNQHCLEYKVIIRAFDGEGARVTIGEAGENDTFLTAARSFPREARNTSPD